MSQRIHLDATPGLFHQVLHCHQGDVGRQFEIAVVTRDGYEIPSGATFKIQATKPSGLGFTVTGTAANNIISFTSTEDMTSEAGEIPTQLEIKSGNDVIYTSNFLLVCEKNTHPSSVTDGSPEEIISEITLLVERAETAASTAGADAAAAAQARVDEMMDYLPSEVADLKSDIDGLAEFDTDFLNDNSNIVYRPMVFDRGYVVRSNGTKWNLTNYGSTRFLPVEASKTYYIYAKTNYPTWITYYDSSQTIISGSDGASIPKAITTPSNCAYIRLGFENVGFGNVYLIGSNANKYGVYPADHDPILDKQYTDNALAFLEEYTIGAENLALYSTWKKGYYRNTEGNDRTSANWSRSDYIPVEANKTYYASSTTFVCYYDSSRTYLSSLANPSTSFTTPSDCAYVVVSYEHNADKVYWLSDKDLTPQGATIYVGADESYTTIRSAMDYANTHKGTTVIVKKGTYDIVSEFGGQSQMPSGGSGQGMVIGNGTTILFETGAVVECIYTGGDSAVESSFSIFNASHSGGTIGNDDYTIIGLVCRAKNIRYCIHDEMSSQSNPYIHKYLNCDMYLDNTESSWDATQCIGGGLGDNGDLLVEDCVFETGENNAIGVSWHNHWRAGSKSVITIKDCYFRNCTIRFGNYGNQTENTICKVSNNVLSSAPTVVQETSQTYPEKMELLAWNNVIRN